MDIRIDLTENRDFRHNARWEGISKIKPYKHPDIPSILHDHLLDLQDLKSFDNYKETCLIDNWGILQGDSNIRQYKKMEKEFCNFITCDCCGKALYPYYHDGLCVKCRENYNYEIPEWRR